MINDKYPQLLNDFLTYLENKGYSDRTMETYGSNLINFFAYMEGYKGWNRPQKYQQEKFADSYAFINTRHIKSITDEDIEEYLNKCKRLGNSNSTIQNKLETIKSFFTYLKKKKIINDNPTDYVESLKIERKVPKVLNENDVRNLLEVIKNSNTCSTKRDYAIFLMLFTTGMRADEILSIDEQDVDFETQTVVIQGKGGKERTIYLTDEVVNALKDYLNSDERNFIHQGETALFISSRGHRLSYNQLRKRLKEYGAIAGIDEEMLHVHITRHTVATQLLKQGEDLRTIQEFLGHERITTTQIYTHVENEQIKKAVNKLKW